MTNNLAIVENDAAERSAAILARAAILIQMSLKQNLSKSFPPASKVGEFPHGRTWGGRDAVDYEPKSLSELKTAQRVRIGFQDNAWYMPVLEVYKGRLGMVETVRRILPQLQELGKG